MPDRSLVAAGIIVWSAAILVTVFASSAFVLANADPALTDIAVALGAWVSALATVALAAAAFLALGSVREARDARNAVQMTELSRRWDDETNRSVRKKVMDYATKDLDGLAYETPGPDRFKASVLKLRDDNADDYRLLLTEPNTLEDLAIMVEYRGIDFEIVNLSLGWTVPYRWSLWKPTVDAFRVEAREPLIYWEFEKLAKRIAKRNPHSVKLDDAGEIIWEGFRE
jgi:hypothetical protein